MLPIYLEQQESLKRAEVSFFLRDISDASFLTFCLHEQDFSVWDPHREAGSPGGPVLFVQVLIANQGKDREPSCKHFPN